MTTSTQLLSREFRIYLAIWRKAQQQRAHNLPPVSINVSSYSMALTVRNNMYRAIRPYRFGEAFDDELRLAAENFVVSVAKNPDPLAQHQITLKPRLSLSELEAELANLGLDEADLILPEEAALNAKLSTFITPEVEEPSLPAKPPRRANRFYSRED